MERNAMEDRMKQMALFNDRVPTKVECRGRTVILPDGVADESDPLFISYGNESDAFLKEHGIYRDYIKSNRLTHQGLYNVYTRQASFQFCFIEGDDDFSQILKAWEIIKPLKRRFPCEMKRYSGNFVDAIEFGVFEPSLSAGGGYRIYYVEGQGWYVVGKYAEPKCLGLDDLAAFKQMQTWFAWPKEEEDTNNDDDEED